MRKAKVILSAIAVFAIVGGAMAVKASKASKRGVLIFYRTTTNPAALCSIPLLNYTTVPTGGPATTTLPAYSTSTTTCTTRPVYILI
jgi:hypothetical protein